MQSEPRTSAAANELLDAAEAIEHADHGGDVEALPGQLEGLAEALRSAGRAYTQSASRVIPAALPLDRGICGR